MKFVVFSLIVLLGYFSLNVAGQQLIDESTFCLQGNVATLPPRSLACTNPNEVFACGYGEARCDGLGYCGTPPCHWRCWCKNGYKRASNGLCVKFCAIMKRPVEIESAQLTRIPDQCYGGFEVEDSAKPPAPPKPPKCPANEIWACAYSEGTCYQSWWCGTPPCTWRCWCKAGFKRLSPGGSCTKYCPAVADILDLNKLTAV